ncbi:hypothetical protein BV898_11983 [Hypsibius exemplaris]|uniref:N-acetyltransferase domain-containing protein n=1 Tax=Hypsibius exemplaris TaxID=2072580 RepID=A0A1W0WF65_HYPEX|nr:hypothetical protein BV898_11983 [Hypsibius exemplaris]
MEHANDLRDWQPARLPDSRTLEGRLVCLEKLDCSRHGDGLWTAVQGPGSDPKLFDHMLWGPFPQRAEFDSWLTERAAATDPWAYAVVDQKTGVVHGSVTLPSLVPAHGRAEIGSVIFGSGMQRTPKSTETLYLLAKEAFALGNRRLEWHCGVDNVRSRRAAQRFGFRFEGIHRQRLVLKGNGIDVMFYAILDHEWPGLQRALEAWLAVENFDENERQIRTLEEIRALI